MWYNMGNRRRHRATVEDFERVQGAQGNSWRHCETLGTLDNYTRSMKTQGNTYAGRRWIH